MTAAPNLPSRPAFRRAFQWDLARQVERLDVLLKQLPRYAALGFQELYLHLEDAVDYPSLPGVARRDAYSYAELQKLVRAAAKLGIGVVPIVNLLGHTQYLIKTETWRDLNELRGDDGSPLVQGQICPLHPRTPEVARRLMRDLAPFCTAGKIHVGLDESFHLGRCPRCRAEIEAHGLAYHFAQYAGRLHALAAEHRLRMGMWADMLYFVPEAIEQLPSDVIAYDWYYYPFARHPRVEFFNFEERDLFPRLQAHGIEYWGCPMNGAFRYEPIPIFSDRLDNIRSWWRRLNRLDRATRGKRGRERGVEPGGVSKNRSAAISRREEPSAIIAQRSDAAVGGMLITSWEAYRLAFEVPGIVDAAAASLWLDVDGASAGNRELLRRGVERCFGTNNATKIANLLLASDAYPFSGYARWETNDRWDARTGTTSLTAAETERRHFEHLARAARSAPEALRASLEFRTYLSRRDAFLATFSEGVFALRQALAQHRADRFASRLRAPERAAQACALHLRAGARAARAMWRRSRASSVASQNEAILQRDDQRLRACSGWLRQVRRDSALAATANPVCGVWQCIFDVVNFAPAVQRVSIEARQPDGSWQELRARYTIEFQGLAARPRARVRRPFSLAIEDPSLPLRIVLKGVGEVRVDAPRLTNGVEIRRLRPASFRLGQPAPHSGLPDPTQLGGVVELMPAAAEVRPQQRRPRDRR